MKRKKIILSIVLPVSMIGAVIGSGYSIWHFNDLKTTASTDASLSITNLLQAGELTANFEKLDISFDQSKEGRKKIGIDSKVGTESAHGIEIFGYDKDSNKVSNPKITYTEDESTMGYSWTFTVELKLTEDVISYIDVDNIINSNEGSWEIDTTSTPGSIIFQNGESASEFDWSKITFKYNNEEPLNVEEYNNLAKIINEAVNCNAIYTVEKYEVRDITCTFVNYDGTELETKTIQSGKDVTYTGTTPIKPNTTSDDGVITSYIFKGWDNSLNNVTCNTTFTALYDSIQITSNKDYILYGTYPQTKVDDSTITSELNTLAGSLPTSSSLGKWTDYNYYESNEVSSYMYYIDIDKDGDGSYDYRGVYFNSYRARDISYDSGMYNSWQYVNGYELYTTYWFKYEPIKWKVLKSNDNQYTVITDLILDSQEYYSSLNVRNGATDYNGSSNTDSVYANNYKHSNIRKFLNTTFLNSAFTSSEQSSIETMEVDNSYKSTYRNPESTSTPVENPFACENTYDKMTLVSYVDTIPREYFDSDDALRASATDYAKCQGLHSSTYAKWWMRSPSHVQSDSFGTVGGTRVFYNTFTGLYATESVQYTGNGVRPMCKMDINL